MISPCKYCCCYGSFFLRVFSGRTNCFHNRALPLRFSVRHLVPCTFCSTYDKYYQTPRVWMVGSSADQQPLTAEEMMEDVMKDYRNKTVTMEHHPHTSGIHASIHPCQHGKVMKTIIRNLIAASQKASDTGEAAEEPTVEMYLFIFLKFVSSIIPTINYDFTMDVNASTQK